MTLVLVLLTLAGVAAIQSILMLVCAGQPSKKPPHLATHKANILNNVILILSFCVQLINELKQQLLDATLLLSVAMIALLSASVVFQGFNLYQQWKGKKK